MKRWAVLTVLLYALALLLLTVPVLLIAFGGWGNNGHNLALKEAMQIYLHGRYAIWLAVLVAGQALLLLLPINLAERRPTARRPLKVPVIVTALFLANLFIAGLVSILCADFKEDGFDFFGYYLPFKASQLISTGFQITFGGVTPCSPSG
jgi:hypothetical protein